MQIAPGKEGEYRQLKEGKSQYHQDVLNFAERWSLLMEQQMAAGSRLNEVAARTARRAADKSMSGSQYACAVSALAYYWVHGEDFQRWHDSYSNQ